MGSVAGSIVDSIAKEGSKAIQDYARPMETEFEKSNAGKFLLNVIKNDYQPTFHQVLGDLTKKAKQAGSSTKPEEIYHTAKNIAMAHAFGENNELIAGAYKAAYKERGQIHAQNLADHMAMYLKDTEDRPTLIGKRIANPETGKVQTTFKGNRVNYQKVSKVKADIASTFKKDDPYKLDVSPVWTPTTSIERGLANYASFTMAPFILIPHFDNALNTAISTPIPDLIKGVASFVQEGPEGIKSGLAHTGIFADTAFNAYRDNYNFRRGIIAKATGSEKLGVIIGKMIHQPGFNPVRDWTLAMGAAVGEHSLADAAAKVMNHDPRAEWDLREVGLDPDEIRAQGGKMTEEQRQTAIYNYVDKKLFLNTRLNRAYKSSANPWMRTFLMFHNYVAAEGKLIRNELYKAYKLKGPGLVAQELVVLGAVFPAVGYITMQAERMSRGQAPEGPQTYSKNEYENAVLNWADFMGHMAGFGIATGYTRGALRHQLLGAIAGPIGNMFSGDVQDAAALGHAIGIGKSTGAPAEQIGRDALEQALPLNIGKIIAHRLMPTEREKKKRSEEEGFGGLNKLQGLTGLKGLQKLQ